MKSRQSKICVSDTYKIQVGDDIQERKQYPFLIICAFYTDLASILL